MYILYLCIYSIYIYVYINIWFNTAKSNAIYDQVMVRGWTLAINPNKGHKEHFYIQYIYIYIHNIYTYNIYYIYIKYIYIYIYIYISIRYPHTSVSIYLTAFFGPLSNWK